MDALQVVCFALGQSRCALDILSVREVIHAGPPAPLPRAAPGVEGVIALRGALLPVVDLRKRLGVAAPPPGAAATYVIGELAGERVALIVDAVLDVRRWSADALAPPPPLALAGAASCVTGVFQDPAAGAMVLLLDLARLLDPAELAAAGA
jgi:purine-binding chemotaxis protein CheW